MSEIHSDSPLGGSMHLEPEQLPWKQGCQKCTDLEALLAQRTQERDEALLALKNANRMIGDQATEFAAIKDRLTTRLQALAGAARLVLIYAGNVIHEGKDTVFIESLNGLSAALHHEEGG